MKGKITTALASYGMSGQVFHAPLLHIHPGFDLVKIVERHREESTKRFPYVKVVRDFKELLTDSTIDLIVVNTPDHLHYPMAMQALEAGKHVVVEKPFTLHSDDCKRLIGLAQEKGKMLSVYQNRRWDGGFLTVQQLLRDGVLGRITEFEARFDRYRNYIASSWKEDPDTGTESIYNLGSHLIDQALVLFGMPDAVFADLQAQRDGAKVHDAFEIRFYYPDKRVILKSSYLVKEAGAAYALYGTEGSYIKYGADPQEEMLKAGHFPNEKEWGKEVENKWGLLNANIQGKESREPYPTQAGNYLDFYQNIHDHLNGLAPLAVQPTQACNVIMLIEKAMESHQSGSIMRLTNQ